MTLLELLLAITVLGLLVLVAVPGLAALHDGARVRAETLRLVAALDQARGAAIRFGSTVRVVLGDSSYQFTADPTEGASESWRLPGSISSDVQLAGAGAPILFGAAGLAVGVSNRTFTLTRGRITRRIVLSRLGRITW